MRLGRYETLREIASGGMATVHLGRALGEGGFQRLVAIKLMHPHLANDEEFVSMFVDEGRLAAAIRHPNVVGTLDIDRGPQGLFLVMDYVDGPTLNTLIRDQRKRATPMPLPLVLRIFLDLLAGLHAAHELIAPDGTPLNLVHRDVSPANVLVGRDGLARITDFGVARAEARLTSTRGGELKGKVPYMSPEQLKGGVVDRRCDVYAAGCVLWEMLTLRRLFRADDQGALIGAVLGGPKQSPSEVNPEVPYHLDRACMRAFEGLDDRYRSADAFADAVKKAARHDEVAIAERNELGAYVADLAPAEDTVSGVSWPQPLGSTPSAVGGATPAPDEAHIPSWQSAGRTDLGLVGPAGGRSRAGAITIAVAVAASLVGGAIVWFATSQASDDGGERAPSAAASEIPTPTAAPATDDGAETSTSASASASASATASATVQPSKRPVVARPPRTAAPTPTPTPTTPGTFRPMKP